MLFGLHGPDKTNPFFDHRGQKTESKPGIFDQKILFPSCKDLYAIFAKKSNRSSYRDRPNDGGGFRLILAAADIAEEEIEIGSGDEVGISGSVEGLKDRRGHVEPRAGGITATATATVEK